jgi:hypothetical protein
MTRNWWLGLAGAICAAAAILSVAPANAGTASPKEVRAHAPASEVSAQERRVRRRAPTRIEVRPLRRAPERLYPDSYRECVPVMVERWIPQWGGRVIHASQSCWWTR